MAQFHAWCGGSFGTEDVAEVDITGRNFHWLLINQCVFWGGRIDRQHLFSVWKDTWKVRETFGKTDFSTLQDFSCRIRQRLCLLIQGCPRKMPEMDRFRTRKLMDSWCKRQTWRCTGPNEDYWPFCSFIQRRTWWATRMESWINRSRTMVSSNAERCSHRFGSSPCR